jgi:hypothetical protein
MALLWNPPTSDADEIASEVSARNRQYDQDFIRAMGKAIRAGKESPPAIGIFKDRRPFAPVMWRGAITTPQLSGCGSSALLATDLGLQDVQDSRRLGRAGNVERF